MCVAVKWPSFTASGLAPAPSGNARRLARPLLSYNLTSSPESSIVLQLLARLLRPPFAALMAPPFLPPPLPGFDQPTHATISLALPVPALPTPSHHRIPADYYNLGLRPCRDLLARTECSLARTCPKRRVPPLRGGLSRPCKPSGGRWRDLSISRFTG